MRGHLKILLPLLFPLFVNGQQVDTNMSSLYNLISETQTDIVRMKAYSELGSYYLLEDRDSAQFYLQKALPIAVRLNLKFDEASILNKMGVILMQQEKFARSLEYYLKALNIAKDPSIEKSISNLPPGQTPRSARLLEISESYDLIGLLNAYTGNWSDNIKNQMQNYREAEKYAKAAGDTSQIAYIKFHMGIAYMNEGKLDSAILLIKNAISTFSKFRDPLGLGRATKYLGDTYHKMGNLELAANTILGSLSILRTTNDYVHIALAYISLNRVYTDLNKNDSAMHYARESLKIFEKRKDPVGKKDAYNLIASYFDRTGQGDSATKYLKLAKSLGDSVSLEARKNLLAFQDVVVAEQVKLEKLEKEKIQTKSRIRTYSLIAGVVILSLVGLILYNNNKKEKKAKIVLERTLKELKSTQSQLVQSEKMASLGELTAGIAHEIQNPLNFVNNFSEISVELLHEMKTELDHGDQYEAKALADNVIQNINKIAYHGKRAGEIVKGMLQHSRSSTGVKEPVDINQLADEYVRLSYHGLRAKDKSFNASIKTNFDKSIGTINVIPQDIGRVILNLLTNAFYAVGEKKKQVNGGYDPTVTISTRKSNRFIEIVVSDNGNGIPQKMKNKIFQPFFTTKPAGQGTGLGLSISYDIITKGHGGDLAVETVQNEGTSFIIKLPED